MLSHDDHKQDAVLQHQSCHVLPTTTECYLLVHNCTVPHSYKNKGILLLRPSPEFQVAQRLLIDHLSSNVLQDIAAQLLVIVDKRMNLANTSHSTSGL